MRRRTAISTALAGALLAATAACGANPPEAEGILGGGKSAHPFGPGPRLARAAPAQQQPGDPIARGRQL